MISNYACESIYPFLKTITIVLMTMPYSLVNLVKPVLNNTIYVFTCRYKFRAIASWFQLGLVLRSPVLLWSMLWYSYLLSLWKFAIFILTLGLGNQKLLLRGGKFTICKGIWCLESCIGDLRSWIWGPKPQLGNGGLSCLIESGGLRSEIWEMMVYLTSLMPESGGLSWLLRSLVLFCGLGPSEVLSMTFSEARKLCFTPWSVGMEFRGVSQSLLLLLPYVCLNQQPEGKPRLGYRVQKQTHVDWDYPGTCQKISK